MEPVELDKALQPAVATAIGSIGLSPFINFKDACNHELDFLKHIDSSRDKYYDADYVDVSIRRYEKYWLPLLAELTTSTEDKTETTSNRKSEGGKLKYVPPIDIHWVWHVHMLAPVSYIKDCKAITNGKIIDHQLCSLQEFQRMRENTKPLWEKKFPHVPFEFHDVNSYKELNPPENSKSSTTGTF
jgi:hypothetical protein